MTPSYTFSKKTKWEKGDSFGFLLEQMRRYPLLGNQEQIDLGFKMLEPGQVGKQARDKMVRHNLRLVVDFAQKYHRAIREQPGALALEDFMMLGYFGLIKAAEKFDARKGYRFSTYATWWIRQAMVRSIEQDHRLIRLPTHLCDRSQKIKKHCQMHIAATGKLPTSEQLEIVAYGEPANGRPDPITILQYFKPVFSLDKLIAHDGDGDESHAALVPSDLPSPEDYVFRNNQREYVRDILACLNERERQIISLRYLGYDKPSFNAIAQKVGLSSNRVQQICKKALKKLQHAAGKNPFSGWEAC